MNTPLLIDSIVRQVTVLLAQLGTAGGLRAPMAHLANQVFLHLAEELEAQGVSRKVSADMFGMALRAYVRKVGRLREGHSAPGVTLWQAVLEFIREHGLVLRSRVLERFSRDAEPVLLSVLNDLCESGLVFVLGSGSRVAYRAATDVSTSRDRRTISLCPIRHRSVGIGTTVRSTSPTCSRCRFTAAARVATMTNRWTGPRRTSVIRKR